MKVNRAAHDYAIMIDLFYLPNREIRMAENVQVSILVWPVAATLTSTTVFVRLLGLRRRRFRHIQRAAKSKPYGCLLLSEQPLLILKAKFYTSSND